jgi:hypothetical protein
MYSIINPHFRGITKKERGVKRESAVAAKRGAPGQRAAAELARVPARRRSGHFAEFGTLKHRKKPKGVHANVNESLSENLR